MKKIYLSFVLLLGIHFQTFSQSLTITSTKTDKELTRKIEQALAGFRGQVGVYVRNLRTNRSVAIKADSLFPTASMVKIPILCGVFDKIAQGELSYTQVLTYRDSLRYDDGVVGSLRDSSRIPLSMQVIAKNGAVNQAKSEVVLVHAPHGEYVFCITTKNQEDQRWTADNEGYVLLRTLSGLIWNHFEPDYPWQPLAESPKWQY